jgi:hypothetical protein
MSLVHLHLLLNHIPVIGTIFVLALLIAAWLRWNSDLGKVALMAGTVFGVIAIGVYFTGESAEEAVENLAGVSESLIERHEDAALFATIAAGAFAALAAGILVWFRRRPLTRMAMSVSLAATLLLGGLMTWTSNLGGQIRHSEVRATADGSQSPERETTEADDDDDKSRSGR